RGRAPVGRRDRDGGGGGRVEDAVDDDNRALEGGRQRGGGHALALDEKGAGRQLDEAVGQARAGVVAVAGDRADAGPVKQGAQRRRPAFPVVRAAGMLDDDLRRVGRGGGRRGGRAAGGVHAPAGLAAEPARLDQGALGERGREAGVVAERGPHRAGHGLVHVVPDEVHQRERTHAEAAGAGQHRVDVLRDRGVLFVDPPRFGVERAGDPVDDESGGGGGPDDGLAPGGGQVGRGVG